MKRFVSVAGIFLALVLIIPCAARAAPSSHIREEVTASYFPNGTLDGSVNVVGYVEVDVENEYDVMQMIRLQLSNTTGTNLQSDIAYKNVAASPYTSDRTRIYVNTTSDEQSISYNITDPDLVNVIQLSLDYQNLLGGKEIYAGSTNTFIFNLTMAPTKDVYNVITNLRFSKDTLGMADCINLHNPSTPSGTVEMIDSDWDGYYDIVRWRGDIMQGERLYMTFQGDITPGVNFDETAMMIDTDKEAQSTSTSSQDSTITGIAFSDRFSRGPIRQGLEMLMKTNFMVRGFIKNVATGLDYIVYGWEIYKIGEPSPLISSSASEYLTPDEMLRTDWYDTGASAKQDYYASSFDWEVVWGNSHYSGITESRMYLPILYEMDSFADKTVNLVSNAQSGRSVSVWDSVRHLGHLSLGVNSANITSRIPGTSDSGDSADWSVTGVQVFYSNGTGQYDITSYSSISIQNANAGADGFVVINVTGLQSIAGQPMGQNDDIILHYNLTGPCRPATQDYTFESQTILITESGTPSIKNVNSTITIPGISVPSGPGGVPGYAPVPPHATIEKEASDFRFITDEYVEINVTGKVIDTGDKGLKDVKAIVYIPYDGKLDINEVYVKIYRSSSHRWESWEAGSDFTITRTGIKKIGDEKYTEYVIEKKESGLPYEETLTLFDSDRISIGYRTGIPVGTNYILTRIYGYNYYEDKLIFEDIYTPVRREGFVSRLEITEDLWKQEKVMVGKPVVWKKEMVVYNPNNMTVEEIVHTGVFKDVLSVYLLEYGNGAPKRTRLKLKSDDEGEAYVDWMAKLQSFETRMFAIEITTPPVLETREMLDVLESNDTTVIFFLNKTIVNFAEEDYFNVSLIVPVYPEKIISLTEDGKELDYNANEDGIEIIIGSMPAGDIRYIQVLYEEKPPVMIATLENLKYQCQESISGNVFIIPSQKERGAYLEMEIIGPEPDIKTIFADIVVLGDLAEFQEKKVPISFSASSMGSGRYMLYTKYKKDFSTVLHHQRDFVIDCPEREIIEISWIVFAVAGIAIVAFLLLRIYRKKSYRKEMRELRKKIKDI